MEEKRKKKNFPKQAADMVRPVLLPTKNNFQLSSEAFPHHAAGNSYQSESSLVLGVLGWLWGVVVKNLINLPVCAAVKVNNRLTRPAI